MAKHAKGDTLSAQTKSTSSPEHEQVAVLAYALWQKRGSPEGSPDEDWFQAERELTAVG
jgi:hypothetical protein